MIEQYAHAGSKARTRKRGTEMPAVGMLIARSTALQAATARSGVL